jgi:hypothetical protein
MRRPPLAAADLACWAYGSGLLGLLHRVLRAKADALQASAGGREE